MNSDRWRALPPLFALICACQVACQVDGSPESSSGSHWVRCAVDSECTRYEAAATCDGEYCVDENGARLLENAVSAGADHPDGSEPVQESIPDAGEQPPPEGMDCPAAAQPLPDSTFEGDYVITGQSSIDAASTFTEITGGIALGQRATDDFGEVDLPGLQRVGGSIVASGSGLVRLSLPALVELGGDLTLDGNQGLVETDLHALETIGGSVLISENPMLATLGLDSLGEVSGELSFGPSSLANCEVQRVLDALAVPSSYTEGRSDCSCQTACQRVVSVCP